MKRSPIYLVEQDRGWWIITGMIGTKRYLWHTKAQAMRLYRKEYKKQMIQKGVAYAVSGSR